MREFPLRSGFADYLLYGGMACIQHGLLRLLMWYSGAIPWNYARFLDSCAERILLRKVGGGYIFVHRLLMEHFASLYTEQPVEPAMTEITTSCGRLCST